MTTIPKPSLAAALALLAVPLTWLASEAVTPGHAGDSAGELGLAAAHPSRWVASMVLAALGSVLLVGVLPSIHRLAGSRLALVGTVLLGYGNIIATADCIGEINVRAMVAPTADRAQMVALVDRIEAGPSSAFFASGGLAFMAGAVLLAVALWRSRTVPAWSAVALGLSFLVNIVGWIASSGVVIAASAGLMLAALLPAATALGLRAPRVGSAVPAVA